MTRVVMELPVACPAGVAVGETLAGSGCACRITGTVLTTARDANGLGAFCTHPDGYRACPPWRDEKERIAAARRSLAETGA